MPSKDIGFFSSPNHPAWLWGPPSILIVGYQGCFVWGSSWGVKLTTVFDVVLSNEGRYTSTLPYAFMVFTCGISPLPS